MNTSKISIIGMPWSGKTSVSRALASKIGYRFMDLDHMVEEKEGTSLIAVLEAKGQRYFLDMQYEFLKQIKPEDMVIISTAGSIIYHEEAVTWLKEYSTVVFIDTPFEVIEERMATGPKTVKGLKERGLRALWDERMPLYRAAAHMTIDTKGKASEDIAEEIIQDLKSK
jgi:shikimate kinase